MVEDTFGALTPYLYLGLYLLGVIIVGIILGLFRAELKDHILKFWRSLFGASARSKRIKSNRRKFEAY